MQETQNTKHYDLEDRTLTFARTSTRFVKSLSTEYYIKRLADQFLRSSTSIGANYREANETETKRDFLFRMRICRKEAKETLYWIELLKEVCQDKTEILDKLYGECNEIMKIFGSIITKSK